MSIFARRHFRAEQDASPQLPSTVLFDADYETSGFANYAALQPRTAPNLVEKDIDYGISGDPAGSSRTVAWYTNERGLVVNDVTMPRCQALTEDIIANGNEYWHSLSFYLPPIEIFGAGDWFSLGTPAYGRPYNGPSPLGLGFDYSSTSGYSFRIQALSQYRVAFTAGTWVQFIQHFRFATDGWVEAWYNIGPGPNDWKRLLLGDSYRAYLETMKTGVNDGGANHSGIGAYGSQSYKIYYDTHMITQGGLSSITFRDFGQWNHTLLGV